MLDFNEVKKDICENELFFLTLTGTARSGEAVYLSAGIKRFYQEDPEPAAIALDKFMTGDYGTFYNEEEPCKGHEYGEYISRYGGPIMIHREAGTIKIYFQYER